MLRALHKPTADLKAMSSTHTEREKRPERERRQKEKQRGDVCAERLSDRERKKRWKREL